MKEMLDVEKKWIRKIPFDQKESDFFLARFVSEEQYRFFHDERCRTTGDETWIWTMSGETLDIFRRIHDRSNGKWLEYCYSRIELKSNSDRHRVLFYANPEWNLQKQIRGRTEHINVLLDRWLGIHEQYTIENESGVFICDEQGNMIDFQPNPENLEAEWPEQIKWPTRDMMVQHKYCWHEPEYILKNLHIPWGVYSIGLKPDIYRSPLILGTDRPYSFENCVIIGQLTFPASLMIVGELSFAHSFIYSTTLNAAVYGLGNYAFCSSEIHSLKIEKDLTPPPEDISSLIPHTKYVESVNLWLTGRQFDCKVDNLYVRKGYPYKALFNKPLRVENVFEIDSTADAAGQYRQFEDHL